MGVIKLRYAVVASLLLTFTSASFAHGPTRQKVIIERTISAPAEKCWALVGDFAGLHKWLPPVTKTEIIEGDADTAGAVRKIWVGEKALEETLKSIKPESMKLKYKISLGDLEVLPVNNYSSTLSVKAADSGCVVRWLGAFYRGYPNNDPPEHLNDATAIAAVEGLYNLGLDNLKIVLESQ